MRIAFFSDLHIYDDIIASQTDLGGASRLIPERLKEELNGIQPDLIFNLGDSTSIGATKEWLNYNQWRSEVKAPIYEVFGNHDRNYNVFCSDNVGEEFFTVLGWASDTKALKFGNNIFILISEEYSPAGSKDMFTATIPDKRLGFVESVLRKYASGNNIWILSHTPISGTTVLSTRWMCNNPKIWWQISSRYLELYQKYDVVAHFTGHTHIDYRLRLKVKGGDGKFSQERRGILLNGKGYKDLPDTYFLNLPCIAIAHGWLSGRFPFLIRLDDSYKHWKENKLRRAQLSYLDSKGLNLVDWIIKSRWDRKLGRSAIYYMDLEEGMSTCDLITRDIVLKEDVSKYQLKLNMKNAKVDSKAEIVESDLSMQYRDKLIIDHQFWFKVEGNSTGVGIFTKRFASPTEIKGVKILSDNENILGSKVLYNSCDEEKSNWISDPAELGKRRKIKLKVRFVNNSSKSVRVKDLKLIVGG